MIRVKLKNARFFFFIAEELAGRTMSGFVFRENKFSADPGTLYSRAKRVVKVLM